MSDRPTPDVDEAAFGTGRVSVIFARRLARERDKAAEDATNYFARLVEVEHERDEARADADEWQNKYAGVFVERDEAREALREIASLQRYDHDIWDDGDGQIDESEREKEDGMYLLHRQVAVILNRVLK